MADVLESQYAILLRNLGNSSNFEELLHAHEVFLASVTAHTFINNKSVIYHKIWDIFLPVNETLVYNRIVWRHLTIS